jgi:Alkaline and neutral invertase
MTTSTQGLIEETKRAAREVLLNNARGPFEDLPRTAAWGYPEPYTRDLMISALGMLVCQDDSLTASLRRVLETLARTQTRLGHITSLVHDPDDRGASDTTPLFLIGVALYRRTTGEANFLQPSVDRAMQWMRYQSPDDLVAVAQQPTSDWRDEQWVLGYGLYVNALVYAYLRLYGLNGEAEGLAKILDCLDVREGSGARHVHEGLAVADKPYYALWAYKVNNSERFDLLGNSLAIVSGLAPPRRAQEIVAWVEAECAALRERDELALDLPPCLFPYIRRKDPDWRLRYEQFNVPGEYHNGGVWPFVCGFYVAAVVAAGYHGLAREKLAALTELVRRGRDPSLSYGFNEWFCAQDGVARGQDWQSWSAAMYLYAAAAVEQERPPFFHDIVRRA